MRIEETEALKTVIKMNVERKRSRIRPKMWWMKTIENDMKIIIACIGYMNSCGGIASKTVTDPKQLKRRQRKRTLIYT